MNRADRLRAIIKAEDHDALLEEIFGLYSRGFIFTDQRFTNLPETSDPEDEWVTEMVLIGMPWMVRPWESNLDDDTLTLKYFHDSAYQPTPIVWPIRDFLDGPNLTLTQFKDTPPGQSQRKWVVTNNLSDEYQRRFQAMIEDRYPASSYFPPDPKERYDLFKIEALATGMDWGKGRIPHWELLPDQ